MSEQLKLEKQICFKLYNLSKTMNKLYAPLLKELELTYPQYLVMLVLWEQHQPLSVKSLGEKLDLDSGTLSPLLKRMEKQTLITRERDEKDERIVKILLTSHGKHIKNKAKLIPSKLFALTGLTIEQMQALQNSLDDLLTHSRQHLGKATI